MKLRTLFTSFLILCSCQNVDSGNSSNTIVVHQNRLENEIVKQHHFLEGMYTDSYYPKLLVDELKQILLNLCFQIEQTKPNKLDKLYHLSHAATKQINLLQNKFGNKGSEIETVAREVIALDIEELIAPREW
jgi:hypothetical protein